MKKIGFILILFVCLKGSLSWGQYFTDLYFPDVKFARQFEQVELSEFQKVVKKNKESFQQALFTYGSDDPKEWETIYNAVLSTSETVKPSIQRIDFDKDGKDDYVLTFMAGSEYTISCIYLTRKKGFQVLEPGRVRFYGIDNKNRIVFWGPACCDDPTEEFFTYEFKEGKLETFDAVSISLALNTSSDLPYISQASGTSSKTVSGLRSADNHEVIGKWKPGATMRYINYKAVDDIYVALVEINGELDGDHGDMQPHAFLWITEESVD